MGKLHTHDVKILSSLNFIFIVKNCETLVTLSFSNPVQVRICSSWTFLRACGFRAWKKIGSSAIGRSVVEDCEQKDGFFGMILRKLGVERWILLNDLE